MGKTKLLRPRICLILLPPCKTSHNLTRTFPPSSIRMSWMDSWPRPKKHSATPPPLYLTVGSSVPYCHSCGRVISERKKPSGPTEVKYCSSRCRNSKPGPVDRKIEATFAKMLDGATAQSLMAGKSDVERDHGINDADLQDGQKGDDGMKRKRSKKKTEKVTKGDHRIIVECTEVQEVIFQRGKDPEPTAQGRSDIPDMVPFGYGSGKIRPPQSQNSINGSIGGEKGRAERIEETNEMKEKRREGQRIAEEREMVRKAARRGCAFGFVADGGTEEKGKKSERRMCEAVMKGAVVEPSYAKGDWGIRWREKE